MFAALTQSVIVFIPITLQDYTMGFSTSEQDLRREFAYFRQFPECSFPRDFEVTDNGDHSHLTPSPPVKHETFGASTDSTLIRGAETKVMGTARAFGTLFDIFCRMNSPLDDGVTLDHLDLLGAAKLAVEFRASSKIKERIMKLAEINGRVGSYKPENHPCVILETAYHLQSSDLFAIHIPKVVVLAPKLREAIDELPEALRDILSSEWRQLSSNLSYETSRILNLMEEKPLNGVFKLHLQLSSLAEDIRAFAHQETQRVELMGALRKLKSILEDTPVGRSIERSHSEPAKEVRRKLRMILNKVLGYETEPYIGALPWNI